MIKTILTEYLETSVPTGALCAVNIDGVIQTYSAGSISDQEHDRPFYIYSISKTFTATAILLLSERGENFLDVSVISLLPHYDISETITVRQLLNHTSGLSDYFSQKKYQDAVHEHPEKAWSYETLMQEGLKNTPLFPAGTHWSYSNPGYGMLSEIIEVKSGMKFYDFIDKEMIQPLGLKQTRPFIQRDFDHVLLPGIDPAMKADFRDHYDPGWIATGCFISTVNEVTQFYQALFSNRIISAESIVQMTDLVELSFPLPAPRKAAYGLGLMSVNNDPQGRHYGHGGGGPGYATYARHFPDYHGKQITIALVVNASVPMTPFEIADAVVDSLEVSH